MSCYCISSYLLAVLTDADDLLCVWLGYSYCKTHSNDKCKQENNDNSILAFQVAVATHVSMTPPNRIQAQTKPTEHLTNLSATMPGYWE